MERNKVSIDIKSRLLSLSAEQLATFSRLGRTYRLIQSWLRGTGLTNVILGTVTFLLGIGIPGEPVLKTLQALLGLITIVVSLWSIVFPQPIGVIIWGILLTTAGAWNGFIAYGDQNIVVGILAVLQLWWAYQCYRTFRMNMKTTWPDRDTLQLYDSLQRAVRRYQSSDDPDFVRLKFSRRWWQGFLLPDRAVLAAQSGIAMLVAERNKTTFAFGDGHGIWRPRIAGTFDMDGITARNVTFPRSTFERYNRWKGVAEADTVEWLKTLDLNSTKRRPIRFAVILTMAAPILFLLFWAVFAIFIVVRYR